VKSIIEPARPAAAGLRNFNLTPGIRATLALQRK
jgi:hypothetical protein